MFLNADGVYLYYNTMGSGEKTLLLLHGWGVDSKVYLNLIKHYSERYRVLYFDFPPFGLSGELKNTYTVEDYKNLTARLLSELGIQKFDILCHSFGARVAAKLANDRGFEIEKLVIFGGAGLVKRKTFKTRFKKLQYKSAKCLVKIGLLKSHSLLKFFSEDYLALSDDMRETFKKIVSEDLSAEFEKIKSKTLLLWGKNDNDTPLYMGQKIKKLIAGSNLKVLKDCGHYSFLDKPIEFLNAVDAFLI